MCTSFCHLSCTGEETYCCLLCDTDFSGVGNFGDGVRKAGEDQYSGSAARLNGSSLLARCSLGDSAPVGSGEAALSL